MVEPQIYRLSWIGSRKAIKQQWIGWLTLNLTQASHLKHRATSAASGGLKLQCIKVATFSSFWAARQLCWEALIKLSYFFFIFYQTFAQSDDTAAARRMFNHMHHYSKVLRHLPYSFPKFCRGQKVQFLALSLNDCQLWSTLVSKICDFFLNLLCSDDLAMSWPNMMQIDPCLFQNAYADIGTPPKIFDKSSITRLWIVPFCSYLLYTMIMWHPVYHRLSRSRG